jgi:hypothetical protein
MPAYILECQTCKQEIDWVKPMADDFPATHIDTNDGSYCPGKLLQVISPPVIHGVGASGARKTWREKRFKDMDAYRRLRKNGVQPRGIEGAAEIETRAGEKHEVEMDRVYTDRKVAKRISAGLAEVGDPRA